MDMTGITPIVLGDGETVYQVRPMLHGKRLAAKRFTTPEDAAQYRRQVMGKRLLPGTGETAAEFARRWVEDYPIVKSGPTRGRRKSAKTNRQNQLQIDKFVKAYPDIRLALFTRALARQFVNEHPRAGIVMRNVFADALSDDLISANPFAGMSIERSKGRKEQRVLNEDQIKALADCAPRVHEGPFGLSVRALILFAAYAGARLEESFHVRWQDIDFENGMVHLPVCKFDKPRTVLLLPEAAKPLRTLARRTDTPYVFLTKTGKQFRHSNHHLRWSPVRALWLASLEEREQFEELDWHSLRHACGHHFYVTLGFSAEETAFQLGHTDSELVRKLYGHGSQDAVERMKAHLQKRAA